MADTDRDMSRHRILVTNDDGIGAPGIKLLEKIALEITSDVWVVAPDHEKSGAGHSISMHIPIRLNQIDERHFAVTGTPTDCALMAIYEIMTDKKPTVLLSGINRGANLAEDVTYSGTIAAAMEGTLLGLPAIALSQMAEHGHPVKWATAEHFLPEVLKRLCGAGWPANVLINVNFPTSLHARSPACR